MRRKIRVQDGETGTRLSERSREYSRDEVRHSEKTVCAADRRTGVKDVSPPSGRYLVFT